MVADDHQGEGIATLMLEHLAAIARSNGIERFTAEVLADNRAMLAVFAKAGWPLQRRFESGVVDLDWELATTEEFLDSVERREQRGDSRAVARILLPRAIAVIGASHRDGFGRRRALAPRGVERDRAEVRGEPVSTRATTRTSGTRRSTTFPTRSRWRSSPCPPSSSTPRSTPASASGCAAPSWSPSSTEPTSTSRRMVVRARRNGLRIIGPSSMGIASPRPESLLQAALVDVTLPAGQRGDLDAVGLARQLGAASGPRPRARPVLVRVARRQGRHLGQRPPAVLGGGREHHGRRRCTPSRSATRASSPGSLDGCR